MKTIKSIAIKGNELTLFETLKGEYFTQVVSNDKVIYTSGLHKDFRTINLLFDKSLDVITGSQKEGMN